MASSPFDDLPSPLTHRERKVLADLEAGLGDIPVGRRRWRRSVLRALAIIAPFVSVALGVSLTAVAMLTPGAAVALTGLVCTAAASIATALVITSSR